MGKKIFLIGLFIVAAAGLTVALVYYSRLPKNAVEQLEWAKEIEKQNNLEITKLKTSGAKDKARIDELEAETDAAFQEVITKYPGTPEAEEAEFTIIERARKRGDLKARNLIERYEKFMKDHPDSKKNPDLHLQIAKIYDEDLDLKGEAINKYREFADKFPDHERVPEALMEIARIQQKINENEAAEKTLTEIMEKFPDHELAAEAQYERARLRSEKLDKEKEALEDFKEAEEKLPEGSPKQRAAGASREELGKKQTVQEQQKAQDEYYGTQEVSYISQPPDDWNDPTVDVIRNQGVDTLSYDVQVKLDPETRGLDGEAIMTVQYTGKEPLRDAFIVQFNQGLALSALSQNGKDARHDQKGNFLHIALREPMRQGEHHVFRFAYAGNADNTWKGDAIDPKGVYLRPESRWYPYTSWGDEFTVERLDIEVPAEWTAIGPGLLVEAENTVVIETMEGLKSTVYSPPAGASEAGKAAAAASASGAASGEAGAAKPSEEAASSSAATGQDVTPPAGEEAPEKEAAAEEAEAAPKSAEDVEEAVAEETAKSPGKKPAATKKDKGSASKKKKETRVFRWRSDEPIGLLALVANKYVMSEREARPGLVIQCYTYPEHQEFIPLYLDELVPILEFYEETLGEFPFRKMAVAEIPFFPGGYGSPTLLMITDMVFKESNKVVAEFLAHEVAHQWFGNLLGLNLTEDSHPWLSEAFATYVDALYVEKKDGSERFIERIRDMGGLYIESLVAFEDEAVLEALWSSPMYRTLAYEKGGLVIHALRYTMGDEKFFAAMREYIKRNRHQIVTVTKFQEVMSEFHGEDLDWFFDQWLRKPGYPHYFLAEASAVEREVAPAAKASDAQEAAAEPAKDAEKTPEAETSSATSEEAATEEKTSEEKPAEEASAPAEEKSSETETPASAEGEKKPAGDAAEASPSAPKEVPAKEWVASLTVHQLGDEAFKGFIELRLHGDDEKEVHSAKVWHDSDDKTFEIVVPFQPTRAAIDPDAFIIKYPSMDDLEREVEVVEAEK